MKNYKEERQMRPDIEQLEENLTRFPYGDIGGKVVLELIEYIRYLEKNQRRGRLIFGDMLEESEGSS